MRCLIFLVFFISAFISGKAQINAGRDLSFCEGNWVVLNPTPKGGTWSIKGNSSATFSGDTLFSQNLSSGNYVVKYVLGADSDSLNIDIFEYPKIKIRDTTVCMRDTVILENEYGVSGYQYFWVGGDYIDLGDGRIKAYSDSPFYLVSIYELHLYNECSSSASGFVLFDTICSSLRITDVAKDKTILFPNPNYGNFTVSSDEIINLLTVVNHNGELILEIAPNSTSIDLELYTSGIYFLRVKTISGSNVHKLLVL